MKNEGLFDNVRSGFLLDKFQSANGKVATEKVHIGVEEYWTKTEPPRVVEKDVYAYTLPLKQTLQQLLSNPEILSYVLNPVENNDENVLKDVRDGAFFKAHALFSNDRHALIIMFYYDDLQTSNLAGSKPQKFSMFYWSLANVPPHLRSSLRSINLYAVVRTKYFRKFGATKILASFISDIKTLQTEGMKVSVYTGERIFRGSLLFITADTPAAQLLAGMKEGVGGAHSPCRSCDATQETLQNSFSEADFTMRDKVTHKTQVDAVTDPTIPKETAKLRSKLYGINREGAFVELPDHDVTKCLVQDFMHVMLEGVLPLETRAFLRYVILEEHLVTRTQLNHLIKSFDYGHLKKDCPSEILDDHLDSSLKQNSLQHLALGHVLPFLLKPLVESHEGALERLNLLVTLLQICNLCLCYEFRVDDIALLEHMIMKHHTCFKLLYPETRLTPKFHYMIHFPSQTVNFGPPRFQWCLRYEGTHLYFKRLMQVVLCYKNPPLTMCNRFSARRTVQLLSFRKHHASNLLDLGDSVSKTGRIVSLQDYPFLDVLRAALPALTPNDSVMIVQSVTVKGTLYREHCVILIRRETDDFPQFGRVKSVVVFGHEKVLLYQPLETLFFEQSLDAYKVETRNRACRSLCVRDLPFPHPLSVWRCAGGDYVVLFNDVPEFLG